MSVQTSTTPARENYDADYVVVGSGFGGSVSALRLAEKGYRVIVLEAGRRWRPEDFPKTNWLAHKFLWMPRLRWFGIQRLALLRDVLILSGAGVGGGSLVYANTLLVPPDTFFDDARWKDLDNWRARLLPHYETAKRMLGATPSQFLGPADHALREIATELGVESTFHQPTVGVYFGEPGVTAPDPYFGGEGPARTGCTLCGSCMTGCRVGAKNTLDRNYLYLAEKRGAEVRPETTVDVVRRTTTGEGFELETYRTTAFFRARTRRTLRARNVVLACGVLGTVDLLMRSREAGALPDLSPRLGDYVRTNSEAIVGALARRSKTNYSRGIAITSGFYPEPKTHIEVVRYGAGHDAMGRLATLMVDGGRGRLVRLWGWILAALAHPVDLLRTIWPFGWAKATTILLVMQNLENHLSIRRKRGVFGAGLTSETPADATPPPTYIPVANLVARKLAKKIDGIAVGAINEAFLDVPTTAHVLGGCTMGRTAEEGVIAVDHSVHGYPGLYVCDGSAISANLGVNPSLTICAMTEAAMARIPAK